MSGRTFVYTKRAYVVIFSSFECRSWRSPTAHSRNREEPAGENKSCSGTTEIEQQAQRLLFKMLQQHTPTRHVRKDHRIYEENICRYVQDPLDQSSYSATLNNIHRDAINSAVAGYRMNVTRVVLAQLRSGWSNWLNAFRSRIDRAVPNECPACGQGAHNTHHIFNCSVNSTSLCPMDLWTHPVEGLDINAEPPN
ncbi:hypothetical protein CVS40_8400 [Lucilia cuprina]|nr:hypothetical protein CVS40_8400 [Lucilia cuprina]